MLIFIVSVVVTSLICLCFFKNKFWENRYLVLLICAIVAFIATITTNFSIRNNLSTKVEIVWSKPIYTFYLQDSIINDSSNSVFINNYDFYEDHNSNEFYKNDKDSTQIPVNILLFINDGDTCIGYFRTKKRMSLNYKYNSIYLAPSESDTTAYRIKKELLYDVKSNNWVSGLSLHNISTIEILYIPPKEYALIPDSLIRKIPF